MEEAINKISKFASQLAWFMSSTLIRLDIQYNEDEGKYYGYVWLQEFFTTPGLSKRISALRKKIFPLITDPHIRAIALRSLLNYGWYLVSNDLYIGLYKVNRQVLINQLKALGRDYAKECE